MKYLKRFNEEVSKNFKNDVEILYRNKDMVCLHPKSQKAAHIYGYRTKWCNVNKKRWDELSGYNVAVIVFMFKEKAGDYGSYGYKLRLVYSLKTHEGDWGDASGVHMLHFKQTDPFKVGFKPNSTDDEVKAVYKILSIPQECKNAVRNYLSGKKPVEYIKKEEDYISAAPMGRKKYDDKTKYLEFKHFTMPAIKDILSDKPGHIIDTKYDVKNNKFIVTYSTSGPLNIKEVIFNDMDDFDSGVVDILKEMMY